MTLFRPLLHESPTPPWEYGEQKSLAFCLAWAIAREQVTNLRLAVTATQCSQGRGEISSRYQSWTDSPLHPLLFGWCSSYFYQSYLKKKTRSAFTGIMDSPGPLSIHHNHLRSFKKYQTPRPFSECLLYSSWTYYYFFCWGYILYQVFCVESRGRFRRDREGVGYAMVLGFRVSSSLGCFIHWVWVSSRAFFLLTLGMGVY